MWAACDALFCYDFINSPRPFLPPCPTKTVLCPWSSPLMHHRSALQLPILAILCQPLPPTASRFYRSGLAITLITVSNKGCFCGRILNSLFHGPGSLLQEFALRVENNQMFP
jgi:hypothetical protein